jgi:hypothetical protein
VTSSQNEADAAFQSVLTFARRNWTKSDIEEGSSLYPRWNLVQELGVLGAALSEAAGGFAERPEVSCAVIRAIGHSLLPSELLSHITALFLVADIDESAVERVGKKPIAVHIPRENDTLEFRDGILRGHALFDSFNLAAGKLFVFANDLQGGGLYMIDGGALKSIAGAEIRYIDRTMRIRADLENVAAVRVARDADPVRQKLLSLNSALMLCYLSGVVEAVCATTGRYARQRLQFGAALDSFQAVQLRLSRMVSISVLLHWWAEAAITSVLTNQPDRNSVIALASAYAADNAEQVAFDAHQIHGGMGFAVEYGLHLFTRRIFNMAARLKSEAPLVAVAKHLPLTFA